MARLLPAFLVLLTAWPCVAQAQAPQPLARTTLFGQLGGDGLALSLNVDYMATPAVNVRAGLSTILFASGIPLVASYHLGANRHRLEVGAGAFAITSTDDDTVPIWGLLHIGYRHHPRVQQWLFRAGVAVVYDGADVILWPGASVGRGLRLGL